MSFPLSFTKYCAADINGGCGRIYCGHEDAIEVFDVSRPGEGARIATTPSRKSKDGLKGAHPCLLHFSYHPC